MRSIPVLHPELQCHFVDGLLTYPPLFDSIPVITALIPRMNRAFEFHRDSAFKYVEWDEFYPHLPWLDRCLKLMDMCYSESRDDEQYFRLVGQHWNDWRSLGGSSASYLDSFLGLSNKERHRPAWRHLMTPTEQNELEQLPKIVRVYRGHHEQLRHGMSWTLDPDIAWLYAAGMPHGPRFLSTGLIARNQIIAYFNRREEAEVILVADDLYDVASEPIREVVG